MVKHRVGPAENEINVAGNLAVTVVLFGVQPGRVLPRTAEAVFLPHGQRQGSGEERILVAVQGNIHHAHTAGIGIYRQRLAAVRTITGGVFHGQVLQPGAATAKEKRLAAKGTGALLAGPGVAPGGPGGDHGLPHPGTGDDVIRQFQKRAFIIGPGPQHKVKRLGGVLRGSSGGQGGKFSAAIHGNGYKLAFHIELVPFTKRLPWYQCKYSGPVWQKEAALHLRKTV